MVDDDVWNIINNRVELPSQKSVSNSVQFSWHVDDSELDGIVKVRQKMVDSSF